MLVILRVVVDVLHFFLFQKVQHELLSAYATQLLEKEHSGCHALLRDDKVLAQFAIFDL